MHLNNIHNVIKKVPVDLSHLTRGEQRIAEHINQEVGDGKPLLLSKNALNLINNYTVLNNSQRNSYDSSYFGALGRRLIEVFIRKHLISEFSNKNVFFLNLYDKALRSHNSRTLQNSFNFSNLVKPKSNTIFEKESLANRFYCMFSMIYATLSVDNVEKILMPLIKKGIKSDSIDFLLNLLHGFYKDKLGKQFVINVIPETDGRSTAICKVGEEIVDKVKDKDFQTSRKLLLKKILAEQNIYCKNKYNTLTKNVFSIEEVSPLVNQLLKDIGFLNEQTKGLVKHQRANDIIFRAFHPCLKVDNSIDFQKLEFYGDAVSNMLIERFLLEKNLPINEKVKYYANLKSNAMFGEFFDKLDLQTYLYYPNMDVNPKIKADTFEALMGALHLTYSERAVYQFFKPILEDAYQKIRANKI